MPQFNAQDEFAKLVEDVRNGQIGRPMATERPVGTKFVPHRPDIVLTNLPVFHMVGDHTIDIEGIIATQEAIGDGRFHLPYPRCAFMMSVSGDSLALHHLRPRFHVRHTYVVVIEEDDERLHFIPFMRNELLDHWVRQLFDIYVPLGAGLDEVEVTYDPAWGDFPSDFIAGVELSLWTRLQVVLSFIHKMMTRRDHGTATPVVGSVVNAKIAARRVKMQLPAVPQVITIDLDQMPAPVATTSKKGTGSPKKPHFRQGAWHTRKATGKRSWHPPVAVHGGGEIAPPWYEVKSPPL